MNTAKCPYSRKYELVDFLVNYHKWPRAKANRLNKRQLYAIYYKLPLNKGKSMEY